MAVIQKQQIAKLRTLLVALQELVDSLDSEDFELPPEVLARIEKFRSESRCLYCEKPLNGKTLRGCHQRCYNLVNTRIFRAELTRSQAIAKGWLNPIAEKPGRKSTLPDPMRDQKSASFLTHEAAYEKHIPGAAERRAGGGNSGAREGKRRAKN